MAIDRGDPNYGTGSAASTKASDISVTDIGSNYTGNDVEAVLAEISDDHIENTNDPHQVLAGGVSSLQFTPGSSPAHSEGLTFYDSTSKTLNYYTDEPEVTLNIGEEQWVRIRNTSGVTITNGSPVYISGAASGLPTAALAKADAIATTHVVGVATHDIENNSNGLVTLSGIVRGMDTSSFSAGDELFLSEITAGVLTTTVPPAGNYVVDVGTVLNVSATEGVILAHTSNPSDMTTVQRSYSSVKLESTGATTGLSGTFQAMNAANFSSNIAWSDITTTADTTFNSTDGYIQVPVTGTYRISLHIAFSGAVSASNEFEFTYGLDDSPYGTIVSQEATAHTLRTVTTTDKGSSSFGLLIGLTAGDRIYVMARRNSGSNEINISHLNFLIEGIGQ